MYQNYYKRKRTSESFKKRLNKLENIYKTKGPKAVVRSKIWGYKTFLYNKCCCPKCGKNNVIVSYIRMFGMCKTCYKKTKAYKQANKMRKLEQKRMYKVYKQAHQCVECGVLLPKHWKHVKCTDCMISQFVWTVKSSTIKAGMPFPKVIGECVARIMEENHINIRKFSPIERSIEEIIEESPIQLKIITANGVCYRLLKYSIDRDGVKEERYNVEYYNRI